MIVRVYLAKPLAPRGVGPYVVEETEARELAAAGVLEPRLELQNADDEEAVAALALELFPAPPKEA